MASRHALIIAQVLKENKDNMIIFENLGNNLTNMTTQVHGLWERDKTKIDYGVVLFVYIAVLIVSFVNSVTRSTCNLVDCTEFGHK